MKPVTIPFDFYIACTFKDVDLYLERATLFFYKQHLYKQHPEAVLLTTISKKTGLSVSMMLYY